MCRECMCCYASCPALQEQGLWETYAGPGAIVQIAQRHLDPHDEADRVGQAVFAGAWNCLQCGACARSGKCVFADDGVNEFVEKAREADGFVFATPVYYAHPSGRIFSFLDRAFYSNGRAGMPDAFRFKPGASVAVARRGGISASFDALNKYFGISQMPVAGSTYWNMVHGAVAEDAPQDEEGMQTLRNLARNMIWMMRCFAVGKEQGVPYPETEKKVSTNFVRR